MILEDVELTALQYVMKVLDGKVYHQQFSVEGTVSHLNWFELSGEVGDWVPLVINKLL